MVETSTLQSIGILFICILAFAVLLLIVILFVAINYSVKIKGQDKDIQVKAVASCIFGAVRATALYGDGDLRYKISAFGITIKVGTFGDKRGGKKKNIYKKSNLKKEKKKFRIFMKKAEIIPVEPEPAAITPDVSRETVLRMLEEQKEKEQKKFLTFSIPKLKDGKSINKSKTSKQKKPFKEKFSEFWKKLQKVVNRTKEYKDKALKIKRALDTKTGKRAIKFVKCQLLKLLRAIKPDSIMGYVKYGAGDPSTTAKVYGIAAQASFFITDDQLEVIPDFENKIIDIDVKIKGRIYLYEILIIAIKTLANSDVSRIWKEIRRITNG